MMPPDAWGGCGCAVYFYGLQDVNINDPYELLYILQNKGCGSKNSGGS